MTEMAQWADSVKNIQGVPKKMSLCTIISDTKGHFFWDTLYNFSFGSKLYILGFKTIVRKAKINTN